MGYQWDPEKNERNKEKHGISFEDAIRLFDDPEHLILTAKSVENEHRLAIIGRYDGKLWTCIATEREGAMRIISCRRAREKEIEIYEETKKDS